MSRSFFDAVSGQPLHPAARQAFEGFADRSWADPNVPYFEGRLARQIMDAARETAASVLSVPTSAVTFRTDSPDAARVAMGGIFAAKQFGNRSPSVAVSRVERQVVLDTAAELSQTHIELPVSDTGAVEVGALTDQANDDLALVTLQAANQEIGTRQPVGEVADWCRTRGVPLVMDATATLGYDRLPASWDVLFADADSWAGPRNTSIVAIRPGVAWVSPTEGDSPTDTADVGSAAAAASALAAVSMKQVETHLRLRALTDQIRSFALSSIPDVELVGDPIDCLPQVVTLSFLYVDGQVLADELDRRGFAVGSGSACVSDAGIPSHVVAATGRLTQGNVRLSLPFDCSQEDVDALLPALADVVTRQRAELGVTDA